MLPNYTANYNDNLADSRNNHNMHDNGKYHNSVVGPLIFPLISIEQVVPATLHILLGVVFLLYNLLLEKCKQIDNRTGALEMEEKQKMSEDEWKEASLLLLDAEKNLMEHCENIIAMTNRLNRYEAVLNDNTAENVKLSNVSDVRKKSMKRTAVEKCKMQHCFVTTHHDINVLWVQCDSCDSWLHVMCEGRSSIEELENDGDYICVECSGIEDHFQIFADKINKLIDEEEELSHEIICLGAVCDDLNAVYHNVIGSREKALISALESIKVVRQAYHGNVMVGNHCVKVLKNCQVLTNVISDEISYNHFNEIFDIFNDMTLVMSKRFLTEEEILKFDEQCVVFGQKFPMYFPERNINRKMHELIFNIPKFVHKYKTIGMLSEQEGESNASINAEI